MGNRILYGLQLRFLTPRYFTNSPLTFPLGFGPIARSLRSTPTLKIRPAIKPQGFKATDRAYNQLFKNKF